MSAPSQDGPLAAAPRVRRNQLAHTVALLEEVLASPAPADAVMNAYFRAHPQMGARDRALAAETVFTVLRRWRRIAADAGRTDTRAMVLTALLRQGVPRAGLAPLVADGERAWLDGLAEAAPPSAALSPAVASGFPDWVFERLTAAYPPADVVALGASLQEPAPLDLRVNALRMSREAALAALRAEGLPAEPTPLSPVGLRLDRKVNLRRHALFESGAIEVQDEGSQLLGYVTDPRPGERVADFCAGAGGKTLLLGALMRSRGTLLAFDVSEARLRNLAPRLRRSGLSNVRPRLLSGEDDPLLKRLRGSFDRVLVDAPCSGFGTLRRNPDLKWRQSPAGVAELVAKQERILRAAARLVKPGGRLVYATCSLLPEENEEVVTRFLAGPSGFGLVNPAEALAAQGIALETGLYLRLRTDLHRTDTFFAAVLARGLTCT